MGQRRALDKGAISIDICIKNQDADARTIHIWHWGRMPKKYNNLDIAHVYYQEDSTNLLGQQNG